MTSQHKDTISDILPTLMLSTDFSMYISSIPTLGELKQAAGEVKKSGSMLLKYMCRSPGTLTGPDHNLV